MGRIAMLRGGARLWWRVVTAWMKGVTARNAFHREPATAQWAVRREAGGGISRTSGLVAAAGPQKRGQGALVQPDQPEEELADGMGDEMHGGGEA
jgi:hypothetical protein